MKTQMEIVQKNEEKRQVFGWAYMSKDKDGNVMVDHSGDVADINEVEKAAYMFVKFYRDGSDNHERGGAATLVESILFNKEKTAALGIPDGIVPEGWWVGFEVTDDGVWGKVKAGVYKMFSIEGSGTREPMEGE
jgi:hypothetical protein